MPIDPHGVTRLSAEVVGFVGGGAEGEAEGGHGKVFYVCNATSGLPEGGVVGSNNSSGLNPRVPLSTIDYAIGLCVAGRSDKIVVLPGHSESTSAVITLDNSSVTIEGRGSGTRRPQITVNYAGDGITVTAANR